MASQAIQYYTKPQAGTSHWPGVAQYSFNENFLWIIRYTAICLFRLLFNAYPLVNFKHIVNSILIKQMRVLQYYNKLNKLATMPYIYKLQIKK
ncbi:hypothetical protein GCM10023313_06830 [Mucilaginibacter defluvii]|uniref:Uncharacterized protein n=1 Tax=Mucilaginibacter defluvii TaxID=1196019 RepID=A0ABP9FKI8_9SPHI